MSEVEARELKMHSHAVHATTAPRFGATLVTLKREQQERVAEVAPSCRPVEASAEWPRP
jgi:hypothetical protein